MKLIACHINNFGKLSDLNINFNDGVNVINQPNGWGKSTLAAFLKAMLYGFDTKKEPGAFERERKLYKPWQGGTYGGELDFEADGVEYRLVRTFGLTEKQDDFHLYRLATMVECDDFSPLLGEELFDLDPQLVQENDIHSAGRLHVFVLRQHQRKAWQYGGKYK